jgi:holliday junction DNA helicase RuvA
MFSYIKGKLTVKGNGYLVVEANGIGYKISTSATALETAGEIGRDILVHTYLYVREDIMCLYGFLSQEDLGMFELLLTVSGIGPKAALSLISSFSAANFSLAVITSDAVMLSKAPGIGNKTAQKIILELKDKIKKELISSGSYNAGLLSAQTVGANGSITSEAISALMILGYSAQEAGRTVSAVKTEGMDLEAVIKTALKSLGQKQAR